MSTRANVTVKDRNDMLWFYRHSDGYPDGALPTLSEFMRKVASGEIRDNVVQAAGWLIVIGHKEYLPRPLRNEVGRFRKMTSDEKARAERTQGFSDWKVGAYEPTTTRHGDIEYLYALNLENRTINVYKTTWDTSQPDDQRHDGSTLRDALLGTLTFAQGSVTSTDETLLQASQS